MTVDPNTGVFSSGSLDVRGYFDDGYDSIVSEQSLLTGTLSQLGYTVFFDGNNVWQSSELQFVFNVTGGALEDDATFTSKVAVLLHQSQFRGAWDAAFSSGSAYSDSVFYNRARTLRLDTAFDCGCKHVVRFSTKNGLKTASNDSWFFADSQGGDNNYTNLERGGASGFVLFCIACPSVELTT